VTPEAEKITTHSVRRCKHNLLLAIRAEIASAHSRSRLTKHSTAVAHREAAVRALIAAVRREVAK
jgi:hypothetical protein